jgi:hypothetical protein
MVMKFVRPVSCFLLSLFLAGCHSPAAPDPVPAAEAFDPRPVTLKAMDTASSYRRSMIDDSDAQREGRTVQVHNEFAVEVSCPGRSHYRQTYNAQARNDEYFVDGSYATLRHGQWIWNHGNWKVAPGCPGDVHGNNFGAGGANDVVSARDYLRTLRFSNRNKNDVSAIRKKHQAAGGKPAL